jgi:hypothetical protein
MENSNTFKALFLGAITALVCQTGFSAFKEISNTGNVVQASHNAQELKRTSIESPDFNVPSPPKSSDIWQRISQSTQYGTSIGNTEQTQPNAALTKSEVEAMRQELAQVRIEMAQMQSTIQALQIELMPGSKMLVKN